MTKNEGGQPLALVQLPYVMFLWQGIRIRGALNLQSRDWGRLDWVPRCDFAEDLLDSEDLGDSQIKKPWASLG